MPKNTPAAGVKEERQGEAEAGKSLTQPKAVGVITKKPSVARRLCLIDHEILDADHSLVDFFQHLYRTQVVFLLQFDHL